MKLTAAAIGLAAALAAASPAAAEPLFATFERLCIATAAESQAAFAAADSEGWMPLPKALMEGLNTSKEFKLEDGRMKSDPAGLLFMMQGGGERRIGWDKLNIRICAIGAMPGDAAALRKAAADWTRVEPNAQLSDGDDIAYVFEDTGAGHRAVADPDDAQTKRLLKAGKVKMIFLRADPQMVLVAYGVPTL